MEKSKKKSNHIILIIIGTIFLVVGLVGSIFDFPGLASERQKGAYRYFAKSVKAQVITQTQEAVEDGESLPPITVEQREEIASLKNDLFFIHSQFQKYLEHPNIPDRIEIPSIKLIAPVIAADFNFTDLDGETFGQWQAPSEFAAGWHPDSSLLGESGNTVINGHHNEFGEVFGKLVDVKEGDKVYVYSQGQKYAYIVANRMILLERFVNAEARLENARWLAKSRDERLTLVTCWPENSNSHRLIIVARPIQVE